MSVKRYLQPLLGLNGASVLRLSDGPNAFVQACRNAFRAARDGSTNPHEVPGLPVIHLREILGDVVPTIRLRVMPYEDGMLPVDEAKSLLAILVVENPRRVLEIGTFLGHTTRLMAENLERAEIHTVDLPENFSESGEGGLPKDDLHLIRRRVVGREYKGQSSAARIRQHFADSATFDFSTVGSPTFFFIDGSHTYEYCKNDSEKCFAIAATEPAVFLWHDCDTNHPGVVRLVMEWRHLGRDVRRIVGTSLAYWKRSPGN